MAVQFYPRTAPIDQCSEEYRKYVGFDGIEASFIKDFEINDTLNLDITVLKSTDTLNFGMLLSDFYFPQISPARQQEIDTGKEIILTKLINYSDSTNMASSNNKSKIMLAVSYIHKTITIFHLKEGSESETLAILYYAYPFHEKKPKNHT